VKHNFEFVIVIIILISVIPIGVEWLKARREKKTAVREATK
jgi:membrane-associated protein